MTNFLWNLRTTR